MRRTDIVIIPNPVEGIDKIFEVIDGDVRLRMKPPKLDIVAAARKELSEETERMRRGEGKRRQRRELQDSMGSRPFWHYGEACGKKEFITAQDAFDDGWGYPPRIGRFGMLSPRTCGGCSIADTLYWKKQKQPIPLAREKRLRHFVSPVFHKYC